MRGRLLHTINSLALSVTRNTPFVARDSPPGELFKGEALAKR